MRENGGQKQRTSGRAAVWNNVPGDLKRKYQLDKESLTSRQLLDLWKEKIGDDGRYGDFVAKLPGGAKDKHGNLADLYSRPWQPPEEDAQFQSYGWLGTKDSRNLAKIQDAIETDAKLDKKGKFEGWPR